SSRAAGFNAKCEIARACSDYRWTQYPVTYEGGTLQANALPPSSGQVAGFAVYVWGGVVAAAGDQSAIVSWLPPADPGSSPIASYTVTASPGGQSVTVSGSTTTAQLTGLSDGTVYTFTVTATNAVNESWTTAPSNAVTPQQGAAPPATATAAVSAESTQPTTVSTASSPPPGGTATAVTVPAG